MKLHPTKQFVLTLVVLLSFSLNGISQFGADYSSYGFNFVNDTYNEGLKNWTGVNITDTNKFHIYKQDSLNNYALELKPSNEKLSINYRDSGYMDLNPCSFKINLRVKINQYSGNNDTLNFSLFTGAKKVAISFTSTGIYYINNSNVYEYITTPAVINQWVTYSIALDSCGRIGSLMLENDGANTFPLNFPNNTSSQNINVSTSTNGTSSFSSEIDHIFIYSNPIKWWLGPSSTFIDDTPSGYIGTTGDRQKFLSLPNGEKIGVNENGGGFITFTELTPGGPNLDPRPKFGSGGTKTLRGYFHTSAFNPVQAGVSSTSGGHLVNVTTAANKLSVESFPLHSYFQTDFMENNPLIFPNGDTLYDDNHSTALKIDDDVYDEFGLDMRHELMCELDFNTSIENITRLNEISTVRHFGEWEYIRHPSFILQFHEVTEHQRPKFNGTLGANNDMGEMRHKFEFRLNKDLGYEWILWRDTNNTWQSFNVTTVGDFIDIEIDTNTPLEERFLVFSTSANPNDSGAVAWFYPESNINTNGTVGKSRTTKNTSYTDDRRTSVSIRADWRKTNWCRMNLYVRNDGLEAPCNGDPNVYEAFRMEAHQLFGTPNQILAEVLNYNPYLSINQLETNTSPVVFPNPFTSEITIKGNNLIDKEVRLYTLTGKEISSEIKITARTQDELQIKVKSDLITGIYFLKIGEYTSKIIKN